MTDPNTLDVGDVAYAALLEDAGAYIIVLDAELTVRDVSGMAADLVGLRKDEAIGLPFTTLTAAPVRDERLAVARQVLRAGHPVRLTGMVRGRWMQLCYRPIQAADGCISGLLISGGNGFCAWGQDDGVLTVRAHTHDLGRLAGLSRRELEVLRMISQGMSVAEIADAIYRSPKTVESHRRSLGLKLGVRNRGELWRIAMDAGLLWIEDKDFERLLEVMHNDSEPEEEC